MLSADKKYIWHPFTPLQNDLEMLLVKKAKKCYIYTEDNRKILDAVSSWWVNIHGHGNEYLAEAIYKQALELEHVIFAGFSHKPAITLAKRLLKILPGNLEKVFFSDNGSTAVEVAIKMAFQYFWNQGIDKKKIIALEGAYHGDTFGSMSVADRNPFNAPFQPFLFDVDFIEFPNDENEECILEKFTTLVETAEVTSFIFEPLVQGAAGMRMYKAGFLDQLIAIAKENEVICIADEVMTGFGRTGKPFACDYLENKPDIISISKGLTGGTMPMGITACSQKIISAFDSDDLMKTFFHGHSYTANPLGCAVANASLDIFLSETCQNNIKRVSKKHQVFMKKCSGLSNIKNIRSFGTILAIEMANNESTSYFNKDRNNLYNHFLEQNILLRPLGNVIYIMAPYIITNEQLDTVYHAIWEFLN